MGLKKQGRAASTRQISIFSIFTHDTDFMLVPEDRLEDADRERVVQGEERFPAQRSQSPPSIG